tara:strand:- start:114 stop:446 length:333 start_codon:yes stop_codon:yes gene_type:complete
LAPVANLLQVANSALLSVFRPIEVNALVVRIAVRSPQFIDDAHAPTATAPYAGLTTDGVQVLATGQSLLNLYPRNMKATTDNQLSHIYLYLPESHTRSQFPMYDRRFAIA